MERLDVVAINGPSVTGGDALDEQVGVGLDLKYTAGAHPRALELAEWALADCGVPDHDEVANAMSVNSCVRQVNHALLVNVHRAHPLAGLLGMT